MLTEAGQALADAAIEVETALARARHAVTHYIEQSDGVVSVAAFHSGAATFFPLLLRGLAEPGRPRLTLADEDVAQNQFPRLTRDRVNEFSVVAELVAAGGGLALMPRWTARPHPAIVLKPLSGVHTHRHIDVLHRPERTARKAVRSVLTELHRAAAVIQNRDTDLRSGTGDHGGPAVGAA